MYFARNIPKSIQPLKVRIIVYACFQWTCDYFWPHDGNFHSLPLLHHIDDEFCQKVIPPFLLQCDKAAGKSCRVARREKCVQQVQSRKNRLLAKEIDLSSGSRWRGNNGSLVEGRNQGGVRSLALLRPAIKDRAKGHFSTRQTAFNRLIACYYRLIIHERETTF